MNYYDFLLPDLELASEELSHSINALKDKKILITGATGFFGQWLLYFLIHLNAKYNLQIAILCLSRNPDLFLANHPYIEAQSYIKWSSVNIKDEFDLEFSPDFVFHMATDVPVGKVNQSIESFDDIVLGTKNILKFLALKKKKTKLLLTSSGAVYGKQPIELSHLKESFTGAADPLRPESYYAEAKRVSELLCAMHAGTVADFSFVSARCFAFSGPFLARDKNYAIGNFVEDFSQKRDIVVLGNGQAKRSYMYGADLVQWLVTLMIEGQSGEAYNVGSNEAISIGDLARLVAKFHPIIKVETMKAITSDYVLEQYVPCIEKTRTQLGLKLNFSLEYGIQRMIDFNHMDNINAQS